jgi:hypothetical protein
MLDGQLVATDSEPTDSGALRLALAGAQSQRSVRLSIASATASRCGDVRAGCLQLLSPSHRRAARDRVGEVGSRRALASGRLLRHEEGDGSEAGKAPNLAARGQTRSRALADQPGVRRLPTWRSARQGPRPWIAPASPERSCWSCQSRRSPCGLRLSADTASSAPVSAKEVLAPTATRSSACLW